MTKKPMNPRGVCTVSPAMKHTAILSARSPRTNRGAVLVVLVAVGVAAAACSSAAATGKTAGAAGNSPTVGVGHTSKGTVLVNAAGRTLYAFSADTAQTIVCGSTCTPIWPVESVAAGTMPTAGPGVTGTLGTVTRSDGTHQVTYNGLLLYTYAGDSGPDQLNGQGIVEQYGATKGTWSAVTPTSTSAAPAAPAAAPAAPAPTTTAPAAPATTAPKPAAPAPTTTAPAPATTAPRPAPTTTVPPTTTTTSGGTWA